MGRVPAALLFCALAVTAIMSVAASQDAAPTIIVHVHDADGAAVRNALVRMIGLSAQHTHLGRTDDDGTMTLAGSRCESGLLLIEAPGYKPVRQHISCESHGVVIDVLMQHELARIGSTRSAAPSAKVAISVTPDSPIRRTNSSLVEALDQLSGLATQDQGIGFSAGVHGESSVMTEYSLNGVPLGGGASLAVNSDLLTSAAIEEASDSIALFTASPTTTPHYLYEARIGNFEDSFLKYQASGTVHGDGLGYVAVHTSRGLASELDGQRYLDESGLSYEHRGVRHTTGNLVRLNDAIGATSLSLTLSASAMSAQQIPTYYSGALPAGDGPGTHKDEVASNPTLFMSAPWRGGLLSVSVSRWGIASWNDAASRLVALSSSPQTSFSQTSGTNGTITFSSAPSRNRAITASVSRETSSVNGASSSWLDGTVFGGAFGMDYRNLVAQFTEDWHGSQKYPFGIAVRHEISDRLGGTTEIKLSAQYILSARSHLRYAGTFGTKPVDLAASQAANVLVDPASAQFDCLDRAAFISGPGASGTKTRAANHDVGFVTSSSRSSLSVSIYRHSYGNVAIGAVPVVAASLPSGYFPGGYLDAVVQQYQSAGGCDTALPPARVFVQQTYAGGSADYSGATMNAHFVIFDALSLDANLGLERARITSGTPLLMATPYFPGGALPGVPEYKGNVIVGWEPRDGAFAALLSTTFAGPHNPRQLPPYAVVNVALERRISPSSTATVLVSNLFDTLTAAFISTRLAVPLKDGYGREIPTFASPLLPRRIEARFSVKLGKDDLLR